MRNPARPVSFEPLDFIARLASLVPSDHLFHERVVLRFRSPGCRRASSAPPRFVRGFWPAPPVTATLVGTSASTLRFEIIRPTLGFVVRPFGTIAYYGLC
jgi:hypothetical protein